MARQKLPAPANDAVKEALDEVRVTLPVIGEWLRSASDSGKPLAASTVNNYRDGRREMPPGMRRIFAQQLLKHAERVKALARRLEDLSKD
jgi:hypothetical protein